MQLGNHWEDVDNYSVYPEILLLAVCSGFVIWYIIKNHKIIVHYLLLVALYQGLNVFKSGPKGSNTTSHVSQS